jgi:hypothetical protein
MKSTLTFAAIGEAATGLALLIVPSFVGQLLLGEQLTGVAVPVARVAGIALIALGIACWPGPPLVGMLSYSVLATLYLAYLGFAGSLTGILLWPVVVLHVILTALLMRDVTRTRRDATRLTLRSDDDESCKPPTLLGHADVVIFGRTGLVPSIGAIEHGINSKH